MRARSRTCVGAARLGVALAMLLLTVAAGCASPAPDAPTTSDPEIRRAELEAAVSRDQQRLLDLVSAPPTAQAPPFRDDPELAEIARRLPALQQELRGLRQQPLSVAPGTAQP